MSASKEADLQFDSVYIFESYDRFNLPIRKLYLVDGSEPADDLYIRRHLCLRSKKLREGSRLISDETHTDEPSFL